MTWTVIVAKAARKQLAKFPVKDQGRIVAALKAMTIDPFSGDIVKLEGGNERWRPRVRNYRVFYSLQFAARTVVVSLISRRTSTTC
jgi:mRNA-degrading endonuclease RelE of RelBE toxin-antitoxin system